MTLRLIVLGIAMGAVEGGVYFVGWRYLTVRGLAIVTKPSWWVKWLSFRALIVVLFAGLLAVLGIWSYYHLAPASRGRSVLLISWLMTFAVFVLSSILWSERYRWGSLAQAKRAWTAELRSIRRSRITR